MPSSGCPLLKTREAENTPLCAKQTLHQRIMFTRKAEGLGSLSGSNRTVSRALAPGMVPVLVHFRQSHQGEHMWQDFLGKIKSSPNRIRQREGELIGHMPSRPRGHCALMSPMHNDGFISMMPCHSGLSSNTCQGGPRSHPTSSAPHQK